MHSLKIKPAFGNAKMVRIFYLQFSTFVYKFNPPILSKFIVLEFRYTGIIAISAFTIFSLNLYETEQPPMHQILYLLVHDVVISSDIKRIFIYL